MSEKLNKQDKLGCDMLRQRYRSMLQGKNITDVVVAPSAEFGMMRPDIGLVVERPRAKDQAMVIWALADAEGNGPGWLEVKEIQLDPVFIA